MLDLGSKIDKLVVEKRKYKKIYAHVGLHGLFAPHNLNTQQPLHVYIKVV